MKRILSLLICMAIVISSVGVVTFANENHWSYNYIKGMIESGVVSGDQNGNLNLDNLITRAEFAKTVNKYFGYTVKADNGFNDVSADKWYYEDMLIAKGTGYMIGDASGNANADSYITRAETFVIIARLLNLDDDNTVSFSDEAEIPSWAKGKIGALVKKGIISGYNDGTIKANGNITRAEAFTVVSKNERNALPSDAKEPESPIGNISSSTHSSSISSGGSFGGGGGGGGSSAPVTYEATLDLRTFVDTTFDVELYVENAQTLTFKFSVNGTTYTKSVNALQGANKINLKPQVTEICVERQQNGETFVLESITANAISGYNSKTLTINKQFIGDFLADLKVTGVTDNGYDATTGELNISWSALDGVTDYVIDVYSDDTFTDDKLVASYPVTGATNGKVPVSTDFTKFTFGNVYYIGVAANKNGLVGTVNADSYISKTSGFAGGTGVANDPYIVTDAEHLYNITSDLSACYKQIKDIETPLTKTANGSSKFTGVYDGGNFVINLDINTTSYGGAFGLIDGAVIKNVRTKGNVKSTSISGTAGIVARGNNVVIENCINEANVEGSIFVGGIIGRADSETGTISNCINKGVVKSSKAPSSSEKSKVSVYAGGILGGADVANTVIEITNCHNYGDVLANKTFVKGSDGKTTAGQGVGGIVGCMRGKVSFCSNHGKVEGFYRVGGIVGIENVYATTDPHGVHNSFNVGDVETGTGNTESVGGITSFIWDRKGSTIRYSNNFNAGKITVNGVVNKTISGSLVAYLHSDDTSNKNVDFIAEGFYDISGFDIIAKKGTSVIKPIQSYDCYIVDGENLAYGESISAAELKLLTSDPSTVFGDETIWSASANYWEYPQLVGNTYNFVVKPNNLDVTYADGKYTLTWESVFDNASYEVFVNGSSQGSVTTKSNEITITDLKDAEVYVVATVSGETFTSDAIKVTDSTPKALAVEYFDGKYTLTWNTLLDEAEYEVFVNGSSQGTVTSNSKEIDIEGLANKDVYVVATVNGKTYSSSSIKVTDYVPYDLSVGFANGEFTLTWNSYAPDATQYKVYLNETLIDTTTNKSSSVNIEGLSVAMINVAAVINNVEYVSETFSASGNPQPTNLEIAIKDGAYVLTWDSILSNVEFKVLVNDVETYLTTEKEQELDLPLTENIKVEVESSGYISAPLTVNGRWVGGTGSKEDPYMIATAKQFVETFADGKNASLMAKHYLLVSDIDLSAESYVPSSLEFTGSLKGWDLKEDKLAKKSINLGGTTSDPVVRTPITGNVLSSKTIAGGVFHEVTGATLSHLIVKGCLTVSAATTSGFGGLVGADDGRDSTFEYLDSYVTMIGKASQGVGGLIGHTRCPVSYCNNYGDISGAKYAGGIVGMANSSGKIISYCFNSGNITGTSHTGGIIGSAYHHIRYCGNTGNITSSGDSVGGIFGYSSVDSKTTAANRNVVEECFNTGTIKNTSTNANKPAGGIGGAVYGSASAATRGVVFKNCYNTGVVTSTGIAGVIIGDVKNSGKSGTPIDITNVYDLANSTLSLYSTSVSGGSVANPVGYILGKDGVIEATIKAMVDNTVWEIKDAKGYVFPTLKNNPFDDELEAFSN